MQPDDPQSSARPPSASRTYASYLKLPNLLSLQDRLTHSHDELQFIVVHQVFELWFKLLLFELESIRDALSGGDVPRAVHLLHRVQEIVKMITAAFSVIETMRPYDFLEFRSKLNPASGFQSGQFREIEFLSGAAREERYLGVFDGDQSGQERLRARMQEPSIWEAFVTVLQRRGLPAGGREEILQSLITIHKNPAHAELETLVESLLEYDLLFSFWRSRHILMVQRMIGDRPGTGQKTVAQVIGEGYEAMGSGGVDYLKSTLSKRFFPLLWEARTFVER